MDTDSQLTLARLLRGQRTAALGTLRDGSPFVSLVLFAAAADFSAFYLHISRLAHHTQDLLKDPRASLMVAEADAGQVDPQTLARVSILGQAGVLPNDDPEYQAARSSYLERHPQAAISFSLSDFSLYRLQPHKARYVAGFGKIFNLKPDDFRRASGAA